ncbi:hypothetical protein ACPPVW_18380 [Leifsonia sp. McL0607]|uniref:hypothetical protein n=1 Tax=Leifsonia sp. McL0607 TaxID=3415672 RepID=UPI003CF70965
MPASAALVDLPAQLFRVERPEPPLRFSRITAETAARENAGNRFDVVGGGVHYRNEGTAWLLLQGRLEASWATVSLVGSPDWHWS